MTGFTCHTCGKYHAELPLHYGAPAPASWFAVPEAERAQRCTLTADQCVIDGRYFFVLGNLELPIRGAQESFSYGVWVSLSAPNFQRTCELWEQPGRESEPPYFGWLNTSLPGYPETVHLKTLVHTRPVGVRPLIELEPTAHPLAVEQREGITLERVRQIAEALLHSHAGSTVA
jgi:hypothetical protein